MGNILAIFVGMKHIIALAASLLVFAESSFGGNGTFSFKHISMQDGLSNNKVNSVYRDGMGFTWFSTACGLNRYDGYSMTVFLHTDGDSTSLADNTVQWVADIADDKMLVRTDHAYSIFDKRKEVFSSADHIFSSAHVMAQYAVTFADSEGDIWLSDGTSCSVYSSRRDALTQRGLSGGSQAKVSSICEAGGCIYIVHADGAIGSFVKDAAGSWQRKQVEATPLGLGDHRIFVDSGGDYWVHQQDRCGLWHKSAQTGKWEHLTDKNAAPFRMPPFVTRGVVEDACGRIWVATDHGGINVIDRRQGAMTEVRSHKRQPRSLMSNGISCIYADKQGCVWVGDVSMGVSLFAEPMFKFDIDNLNIDDIDPDFVAQVNAIAEDGAGGLWFGTNESGLLRIDVATGRKRLFRSSASDTRSLPSDIVVTLCADGRGGLWVGTFLGGLCHYDGRAFRRFHNATGVAHAAAADNVWAICQENGKVWFGALAKGLAILDERNGSWRQIDEADGLPSRNVRKIVSLRDGRVAVGTSEGLCIVDSRNDYAVSRVNVGDKSLDIAINDMLYDSRGLLWVCANNGLHVINGKDMGQVSHLNRSDGLPTDATLGVIEDHSRGIWVATASGMTSVEVHKDDRNEMVSLNTYCYGDQDGFLTGSINERAIACVSNGEVIVGRANGVNKFKPAEIMYNKERPHVCFTGLSTFGQPVKVARPAAGGFSLTQALPFCDKIALPYGVNMFTVYFSTMSNVLPEKVKYSYMLEGFNGGQITTNDNYATYTNLTPGHYRLRVSAANCDGLESETASVLDIDILPPWWRTGWAYTLYACAIIAAIFFSIKWIRDRDKAKFRLRQMLDEVERQKQVDDMKLRFFTNISHELRTPLSLIISPLDNILDSLPADDANRGQLELVHRNSVKLLGLVNQLLDFRKADKGGMTLNLSEGDMVSFVNDHCEAFVKLSGKRINFSLEAAEKNIYMKFDKDKIGKVMDNLLSNAYKFTPAGGDVTVSVSLTADKTRAVVSVRDTGMGVPDEHKAHIFERFYQVPQTDTSIVGSGIGLHLVKEFVALHGGSVSMTDNPLGGSIFTVELPTNLGPATESAPDADKEEEANGKGQTKRPTVMIVDDNEDFLTLLRETLRASYDLVEAHDGAEAYDKIAESKPDLIITDVMMPIMDGNALCAKVKGDPKTSMIPLIMLTAKSAEEHNIEGLANGADDYLTKPFNPQILRLKIQKLIELSRKRQQSSRNQIDPEPSQIDITPLDEQLIQKAIAYVEQNIASPNLSVEDLSRHLGMSRVHLYKKLIAITGRPPIEFIRIIRLKRAAQMLKDPAQNVADVAYAVGFNNPKYFSKYFKEEFGVLPSKYN